LISSNRALTGSGEQQAAVDIDVGSGHIGGTAGSEKADKIGNLF